MLSHISLFEDWVIFNCIHENDMKTRTRQRTHSKRELEESGKKKGKFYNISCGMFCSHISLWKEEGF